MGSRVEAGKEILTMNRRQLGLGVATAAMTLGSAARAQQVFVQRGPEATAFYNSFNDQISRLPETQQADVRAFYEMNGWRPVWNADRVRAVETGEMTVVGVNRWTDTEASPLSAGEGSIETVDPKLEAGVVERLKAWRAARDQGAADAAIADLKAAAREGRNIMEPSIVAAKAGVTTGEWAFALREVFGEYRGPTGVAVVVMAAGWAWKVADDQRSAPLPRDVTLRDTQNNAFALSQGIRFF